MPRRSAGCLCAALLCLTPGVALANSAFVMPWSFMAFVEWLGLSLVLFLLASHKNASWRWGGVLVGALYIGFRFWADPLNDPLIAEKFQFYLDERLPLYIALTSVQVLSPMMVAGLRIRFGPSARFAM